VVDELTLATDHENESSMNVMLSESEASALFHTERKQILRLRLRMTLRGQHNQLIFEAVVDELRSPTDDENRERISRCDGNDNDQPVISHEVRENKATAAGSHS
jgi:hypothetical protein